MFNMLLAEGGTAVSVASALASAKEVFTWVLGVITENTLLCAAFCMTVLVPAGVMIFKRISRSV